MADNDKPKKRIPDLMGENLQEATIRLIAYIAVGAAILATIGWLIY